MSTTNFAISFVLAPVLKTIVPQVFLGAFVMVPLDLFLAYIVWAVTKKPVFTLYFLTYGLLTCQPPFGETRRVFFKPFLGLAIGLMMDLVTLKLRPQVSLSKFVVALVFPLFFGVGLRLFGIWLGFQ
jgi:hypothetical protein